MDNFSYMQAWSVPNHGFVCFFTRYGDPAAFEEVYRRHVDMVFGLALRLSGDREEAADLTQETFFRVYRYLGRFAGRSSLKTWIYRIAVNCCRTKLRRRWRRPPERPRT